MDWLRKIIKPYQKQRTKEPHREEEKNRIEVVAYFFLTLWMTADIFVDYGHSRVAVFVFGVALVCPLYLLILHARKAWPPLGNFFLWLFVFSVMAVPFFMATVSYFASFSTEAMGGIFCMPYSRDTFPQFWCVHPDEGISQQIEASPIYILMIVKFTNERDEGMIVNGFQVETRMKNGKWQKMPVVNVHPEPNQSVRMFTVRYPDFKHAGELDFHDYFLQSKLSGKFLNPHESVDGFLLFGVPPNGDVDTGHLRFIIATGDEILTKPIKNTLISTNALDIQMTPKSRLWFTGMKEQDISGVPLGFYGDDAPIIPPKQE